jgi:hypothetical protein
MIKINVFNQADFDKLLALKAATDAFFAERETLSFSGRHPELLSMFNCGVCGRRHRRSHTCAQNYVREAEGIRGPKIRFNRHRNAWGLQVLERATKIFQREMSYFPNVNVTDPELTEEQKKTNQEFIDKTGKNALSRSLNSKRAERAARRRSLLRITQESRQINREA